MLAMARSIRIITYVYTLLHLIALPRVFSGMSSGVSQFLLSGNLIQASTLLLSWELSCDIEIHRSAKESFVGI